MRRGKRAARRQQGFTYFGVLIGVVMIGLALTVVGTVARTEMQREREAQLLWVGHQYRLALTDYFLHNGGQLPQSLQELAADKPDATLPHRYIRKLYPDPMTGLPNWNLLVLPGGGIYGVSSSSTRAPLKVRNFHSRDAMFEDAACYKAWQFVVSARRLPLPIATGDSAC
jgi:type II secretory pathway pseudopilin PulG